MSAVFARAALMEPGRTDVRGAFHQVGGLEAAKSVVLVCLLVAQAAVPLLLGERT